MTERKPGAPVRGSQTGRPIMVLLDVLGQRWTLRILWELRDGSGQTFRMLRANCADISPTVLNKRLKELRDLGLVDQGDDGYALSEDGRALIRHLGPLDAWAKTWADQLGDGV